MSRIFFTLAAVSTLCLTGTFFLGISVDSSAAEVVGERSAADWHILLGVFGLIFAVLVHAIVLTYFMGTGRWIDETSHVYKLGDQPFRDHRKLKQRTLPLMMLAIIALIMIIPTGASVDPAASRKPIVEDTVESEAAITEQSQPEKSSNLHLVYVIITVFVNVAISVFEFRSIEANGKIVTGILDEVRRIRTEKGLPV